MVKVIAQASQQCLEFMMKHLKLIVISAVAILIFISVPLPDALETVSIRFYLHTLFLLGFSVAQTQV